MEPAGVVFNGALAPACPSESVVFVEEFVAGSVIGPLGRRGTAVGALGAVGSGTLEVPDLGG